MSNIYNKFFAKDKPLRHYTQHLFVAIFGLLFLPIFAVELNQKDFILFFIATFIVDLDGFISVIVFRKKIKEAGEIITALRSFNFMRSATLATLHHKKLNRLVIHNIFGTLILIGIFIWSLFDCQKIVITLSWAIICHFTFDIVDDFYQLGHIKNWLWPIEKLLKRS